MNRNRLLAGCGLAIVLLIAFVWHRGAERQSHACFERLSAAFAAGRASGVLAEVHPDYDFVRHWPNAFNELGEGEPRVLATRALLWLFQSFRETPLSLVVDVQGIEPQADGTMVVTATLHLSASGRELPFDVGPIHRHRFVLARDGLIAMNIVDHAPITFSR